MRPCIFVIGTRAQLVKVAPVLRLAASSSLSHTVWFAGQHRESMEDLIADFELQSKVASSHYAEERSSVGKLMRWVPGAIRDCYRYVHAVSLEEDCSPLVVVHGDTLSTFIGAVAGRMAGGEVVHLESGLSSNSILDPFPEEILRRLTFKLTRYAICPNTEASARMQHRENCEVVNTGENTLLDCVRYALENTETPAVASKPYFVASIHRFENIYRKSRLAAIVDEMISVSTFDDVYFVLHPPTETRLRTLGLWKLLDGASGIKLEPRMPFTRFLAFLSNARGVFSDGGSNQEELSYLGVPTVIFRERSERPDGLGSNIVLRKNIGGTLARFVASGRLDALRQPCRLNDESDPSRITLDALSRWSAGDESGKAV